MYYSIRHITRFRYAEPVRETVMEIIMQPRTEGPQRLVHFQVNLTPRAQLFSYNDHLGNVVHHFNTLKNHDALSIEVLAGVEMQPHAPVPGAAPREAWEGLVRDRLADDEYDMLAAGHHADVTPALDAFIAAKGLKPLSDPLSTLWTLNRTVFEAFEYDPHATQVDTPLTEIFLHGRGVCQDLSHVMIAIARRFGIPARYVSGYLSHTRSDARPEPEATHAWVEALVPGVGWVGFDPTNNVIAGERHVRVAVGRDYHDVPPTRGTFRGRSDSELAVAVTVGPSGISSPREEKLRIARAMPALPSDQPKTPDEVRREAAQVQQQ